MERGIAGFDEDVVKHVEVQGREEVERAGASLHVRDARMRVGVAALEERLQTRILFGEGTVHVARNYAEVLALALGVGHQLPGLLSARHDCRQNRKQRILPRLQMRSINHKIKLAHLQFRLHSRPAPQPPRLNAALVSINQLFGLLNGLPRQNCIPNRALMSLKSLVSLAIALKFHILH